MLRTAILRLSLPIPYPLDKGWDLRSRRTPANAASDAACLCHFCGHCSARVCGIQVRVGPGVRRLQVVLSAEAARRIAVGVGDGANVPSVVARVDRRRQSSAARSHRSVRRRSVVGELLY